MSVHERSRQEARRLPYRGSMRAAVVLGALLIVAGCATPSQSAGPTTEPTVGVSAPPSVNAGSGEPELVGITVDGMARQFRLVQPTGVDGQVPLLIALHQYGGNPLNFANMTGFGRLALSDGVMVAFPAGIGATWNAGSCCGTATRLTVDDVAFIAALIDALQDPAVAATPADPNRVYVTGFSNGAMMSLRVACELADRVTAIAPLAGDLLVDCQPSRPVSVLALHGTADAAVPYEALGSVAYTWSVLDGCEEDFATHESSGTIEEAWHGCADGTQLMTITAKNQGHTWFTGEPAASEEIWAFFSPLRRVP